MNMKDKNAEIAVAWQKLCAESYRRARFYSRKKHISLANFYQRQAAQDYREMKHFLFTAIECRGDN